MANIIRETVSAEPTVVKPVTVTPTIVPPVKVVASTTQTLEYLTYFIFGLLEVLLVFRFFFKLTGASMSSGFVQFIYNMTNIFIMPFEGMFRRGISQGTEITAIFEPSTVVAVVVYSLLAWGVVVLIRIFSGEQQPAE